MSKLIFLMILTFGMTRAEKFQPEIDIWAVLVAGSNEYYNYRHQADVCHAYQILIKNGIPSDKIIVFMFDDIANNTENPTPGIIINRPDGPNVYEGVKIDYKGDDVNPSVFMNVLLGNESALASTGTGRVLKSTSKSYVLVNFVDHGGPGVIGFPNDELHAQDLVDTLQQMHQQHMFAKLAFYMEACESGSMFHNLLSPHWNIFATTAANDVESSYACYLDEVRNTYLGDVYSVMWMENADQVNLEQESLEKQFVIVRDETNTSHVQEFGDKRLRNLPVADFLGDSPHKIALEKFDLTPVPSHEVVLSILTHRIEKKSTPPSLKRKLEFKKRTILKLRKLVNEEMSQIVNSLVPPSKQTQILDTKQSINNWGCYKPVAMAFSKMCFKIAKNPFVTRKLYILVNLCEAGYDPNVIINAFTQHCKHSFVKGVY